jgi:hypothetical protein
MRIHSNSLDSLEIRKAAGIAGVNFTRFSLHGSRSHEAAFDVILTGSSTRHQNGGPDKAATWDEWGCFLGTLYRVDPEMKTPYYSGADEFHWKTNGRFAAPDMHGSDFARGHQHRWEFSGQAATGAYTVHECSRGRTACFAVQRFGDWSRVSALV